MSVAHRAVKGGATSLPLDFDNTIVENDKKAVA